MPAHARAPEGPRPSATASDYGQAVHPAGDDYPDVLGRAIAALLKDGIDAGAREFAPIAYPPREIPRRPTLPRSLMAAEGWVPA